MPRLKDGDEIPACEWERHSARLNLSLATALHIGHKSGLRTIPKQIWVALLLSFVSH